MLNQAYHAPDMKQVYDTFLSSRRSKDTRAGYEKGLLLILGDPVAFLELASRDPFSAKMKLITWASTNPRGITASSMRTYFIGVKSLCDTAEIYLPWKNIYSVIPPSGVADEKAPPREAVQKLFQYCDLRMKVIIGIFFSGCRVGAFEWFTRGDLLEVAIGTRRLGRLVVYRGEPEQYVAFLTPEVMELVREYLSLREKSGEKMTPNSPLIRNSFSIQCPVPVRREAKATIQKLMQFYWRRIGYDTKNRDWGICHGFRKYAETMLCNSGMKWEDAELILGHRLRYYKATEAHLASEFSKFMGGLYMSDEPMLKEAVKEKDETISNLTNELSNITTRFLPEMEAMKRKIAEMEKKQSARSA